MNVILARGLERGSCLRTVRIQTVVARAAGVAERELHSDLPSITSCVREFEEYEIKPTYVEAVNAGEVALAEVGVVEAALEEQAPAAVGHACINISIL